MKKRGLIPFVMAGFPDQATSLRLALALIDEGAIVLEVGVPFSDPVADGPVIQFAAAAALEAGASLRSSLDLVRQIKLARPQSSIVLFTYLNPILRLGTESFVKEARAAGVDATLVVDLPPEEAAEHVRLHQAGGLGTIFLASPTSSAERLKQVAEYSTGFIYGISRTGITGEAKAVSESLRHEIQTLRRVAGGRPVAVGFGISTAEQAAEVARIADAVVIGSRFVSLIKESRDGAEAEERVRAFAKECAQAIAGAPKEEI